MDAIEIQLDWQRQIKEGCHMIILADLARYSLSLGQLLQSIEDCSRSSMGLSASSTLAESTKGQVKIERINLAIGVI